MFPRTLMNPGYGLDLDYNGNIKLLNKTTATISAFDIVAIDIKKTLAASTNYIFGDAASAYSIAATPTAAFIGNATNAGIFFAVVQPANDGSTTFADGVTFTGKVIGKTKVNAGGTFAAGDWLTCNTSRLCIVTVALAKIIALAESAGTNGSTADVYFNGIAWPTMFAAS